MTYTNKIACTEIYEILKNIDKQKVMQIPEDIINKIKENIDEEYHVKIDWKKPLDPKDFDPDTINILGYFNYNYWCTDESEKENLRKIYNIEPEEKIEEIEDKKIEEIELERKEISTEENELTIQEEEEEKISFMNKIKYFFEALFNR